MKLSEILEQTEDLGIKPAPFSYYDFIVDEDGVETKLILCACAIGILAYASNDNKVLILPQTGEPVSEHKDIPLINQVILDYTGEDLLSIMVMSDDEDVEIQIEPHPHHIAYMSKNSHNDLTLYDAIIRLFDAKGLDQTIEWLKENNL